MKYEYVAWIDDKSNVYAEKNIDVATSQTRKKFASIIRKANYYIEKHLYQDYDVMDFIKNGKHQLRIKLAKNSAKIIYINTGYGLRQFVRLLPEDLTSYKTIFSYLKKDEYIIDQLEQYRKQAKFLQEILPAFYDYIHVVEENPIELLKNVKILINNKVVKSIEAIKIFEIDDILAKTLIEYNATDTDAVNIEIEEIVFKQFKNILIKTSIY